MIAPVPFYLLAIDQADESGWAVARSTDGAILDCGDADGGLSGFASRALVVARFLEFAGDERVRVIFEDHSDFYFGRGNASAGSLLGMGAARGRWEDSLARVILPAHMKYSVAPKVWRRAVLGLPGGVKAERAKQAAIIWARAKTGRQLSDNASEACCIGAWGVRNLKVTSGRGRAA